MPETQGTQSLPGILEEIVRSKREELRRLAAERSQLERDADAAGPPRDFAAALAGTGEVALIAECKRRSPGAGEIRPGVIPADLARGYERAGASAMSVLTDGPYFGGTGEDLGAARAATALPVLRKDFTIDPLQVLEARALGADAVLLIVRILDDERLDRLHTDAAALGMAVLVEVHDAEELERAIALGAKIIGINNRDLATFTTELRTSLELVAGVPADRVVVSESGIRTPDDVRALGEAGVDAILVGETLLRAADPALAAGELSGIARRLR